MNKKNIVVSVSIVLMVFATGIFITQNNLFAKTSSETKSGASASNEEKIYSRDTIKASINVVEKQSPTGFYPMVVIEFPGIPGSRTESWCYETAGIVFVGYEKTFGGKLVLKHEYDGGTVVTDVIPYPDKVEFIAHVENQTKEPPFLNMCWQLREAENFKAVDEDHYYDLVDREFIFMKDSGRVFLNHTERRPKVGTEMSEWFNTPYPWTQIYKPDWKDLPEEGSPSYTQCDGWSNCSPDRYSKTIIGAISKDGDWLVAIAGDPTAHDLSNAWHDCMHIWIPWKDGIWRNVIYGLENDPDLLLKKYEADFK